MDIVLRDVIQENALFSHTNTFFSFFPLQQKFTQFRSFCNKKVLSFKKHGPIKMFIIFIFSVTMEQLHLVNSRYIGKWKMFFARESFCFLLQMQFPF